VLKLLTHISFLDNNNASKGFRDSFFNLPRGIASLSKYCIVVFSPSVHTWHDKLLLLPNYRISKFRVCLYFSKTKGINFVPKKIFIQLTLRGPCIVIFLFLKKSQRDTLFLKFILIKKLHIFRKALLSIIRSLNTVYTAIGICHAEILNFGKITSVYTCIL